MDFFFKQECLSEERKRQEAVFTAVGRAYNLCVMVALKSRTHPSRIDNVTRGAVLLAPLF